ncbi:hypothetical protein [Phaeospirillum tilakii]|uniref:Flp pilus assembly protein TadG n=1 Tax=Phaeospirillum tilakii TaxID=741673 RepID=A0ABW5CEW3_9PROT
MPDTTRRGAIGALGRDCRGVTGLVVALTLTTLTMLMVAGIDFVRADMVKARAQAAIDAAVLAAGHSLGNANCLSQGTAYFNANMGSGYLGTSISVPLTFKVNGTTVTPTNTATTCAVAHASGDLVTATATIKLPLLSVGFLSLADIPIEVANEAQRTTNNNLELVLALDTTGSMDQSSGYGGQTKLQAMQKAAVSMVTTLFGSNSSGANIFIGLVPFTETVQAGKESGGAVHDGWLRTGAPQHFASASTWGGCFYERPTTSGGTTFTFDATPPATLKFEDWRVASYDWLASGTAVLTCSTTYKSCTQSATSIQNSSITYTTTSAGWKAGQPPLTNALNGSTYGHNYINSNANSVADVWSDGYYGCTPSPVTFLSSSSATLTTRINSLTASGATMISSGMLWAWRMLSPNWRNSDPDIGWGNATLPKDTSSTLTKAVVLLTDGNNAPAYADSVTTIFTNTKSTTSNKNRETTANFSSTYFYNMFGAYQGTPQASSGTPTNRNGSTRNGYDGNILFNVRSAATTYQLHITPGGDPDSTTAADAILTQACTNAKADGITIFTIALNTNGSVSSKTQTLLKGCASDVSYYYNVTDASTLTGVFQSITGALSELRLVK